MQKSLILATLIAACAVATCAAAASSTAEPIQSPQPEATPDGCMPGNGGSAPICTPGTGPGGK